MQILALVRHLGVTADRQVTERATEAIAHHGIASSASQLVAGERHVHVKLEQVLS